MRPVPPSTTPSSPGPARDAPPHGQRPARLGAPRESRSVARSGRRRECLGCPRSSASPPHRARSSTSCTIVGYLLGLAEPGAGLRVEVDAQLVGLLDVGAPRVPWVELHGRHLHRPDDRGEFGHAQLVGRPAGREAARARSRPTPELPSAAASDRSSPRSPPPGSDAACTGRSRSARTIPAPTER